MSSNGTRFGTPAPRLEPGRGRRFAARPAFRRAARRPMGSAMGLALLGYLAFVAACTAVAVRLTLAGVRRQALPELALGLGFLLSGCVGFLLMIAPMLAPGLDPDTLAGVAIAGQAVSSVGFLGLYTFNTVVFAPGSRVAIALSAAGCLLLAVGVVGGAAAGAESFLRLDSPWYWCTFAGRTGAFVWSAVAGLRQHGLARRRRALGLADAVVANRFLLWGLFGVFATTLSSVGTLGTWLADEAGQPPLLLALLVSALGIGAATCMWLAFFPPAAYLRRVRAAAG